MTDEERNKFIEAALIAQSGAFILIAHPEATQYIKNIAAAIRDSLSVITGIDDGGASV